MAAQKGKDILIKIGDGASPENFTTVAGIRTRTLSLNARTVDATDSDSTGQWRELLAGGGVKSMAVSGSGIFRDAATDAAMQAAFFAQSTPDWQLVIPAFGTIEGRLSDRGPGIRGAARGRGDLFHLSGLGRGAELHGGVVMVAPGLHAKGARGEVATVLAGAERRLCLTLGALAELETAFGLSGWEALSERLRALSPGDLVTVLAALLRGGGEGETAAVLPTLPVDFREAADAVAQAFAAAGA